MPGPAPEDRVPGDARSSCCGVEVESRVCSPMVPAAGRFLELRLVAGLGLLSQLCRFPMWV